MGGYGGSTRRFRVKFRSQAKPRQAEAPLVQPTVAPDPRTRSDTPGTERDSTHSSRRAIGHHRKARSATVSAGAQQGAS
jgi:hypothetical protein